jgi:hypothetical protein
MQQHLGVPVTAGAGAIHSITGGTLPLVYILVLNPIL